jgi:GNAT superfamily N-acetyltransferase
MVEDFPKKLTLPDGVSLNLRAMTRDDQYGLYSFFIGLSEEDRRFLRNDVTDRKLIEKWARTLNYDKVLPILAECDGKIVANATLHYQTFGWGRHVAEVRVTIAPEFQGRGLGSLLLMNSHKLAAKGKVKNSWPESCDRSPVIKAFERSGLTRWRVKTMSRTFINRVMQILS